MAGPAFPRLPDASIDRGLAKKDPAAAFPTPVPEPPFADRARPGIDSGPRPSGGVDAGGLPRAPDEGPPDSPRPGWTGSATLPSPAAGLTAGTLPARLGALGPSSVSRLGGASSFPLRSEPRPATAPFLCSGVPREVAALRRSGSGALADRCVRHLLELGKHQGGALLGRQTADVGHDSTDIGPADDLIVRCQVVAIELLVDRLEGSSCPQRRGNIRCVRSHATNSPGVLAGGHACSAPHTRPEMPAAERPRRPPARPAGDRSRATGGDGVDRDRRRPRPRLQPRARPVRDR